MTRRPGVGAARRGGFRGIGGAVAGLTYSPAESAGILPLTAIWISQQGVTQAGTVSVWASYLGGIACTVSQGTAGSRPAYNASGGVGGRPLITFDGVDDGLVGVITKGSAWVDAETGMVGRRVSFVGAGAHWVGYVSGITVRVALQDNSVATYRSSVQGGASVISTSDPDNVDAHYSLDATTGDQNTRKNGAIEATAAITFTSRADGSNASIGTRDGVVNSPANIATQAWYLGPLLTAAQRTYLRALLTFHTGISS